MSKSFFSIGKKMVLLVLGISLISIAATTVLAFNLTDSILKTNVEQSLANESQSRGEIISSVITQEIEGLKSLGNNPVIHDFLENTPAGIDDVSYNRLLDEEKENIANQVRLFRLDDFDGGLKDLKIVNSAGKLIFSLNEEITFKRLPIKQIQLENHSIEFLQDEKMERLLKISVPIKEESRQIGTIIGTIHTTVFDNVLLNRLGLLETGEVYLVNKNKMMISESLFVENAPFKQKVETYPVNLCFENNQSIRGVTYDDYRGVEIFGVSYCKQDLGFVLLTEVDENVVLKPIYELQEKIIIIGISIMIIASIVTFVLSRRITSPILQLRDAAEEIAAGNFGARSKVKANDEIGHLSSSFNSMAQSIQETISAITRRENIIKQQENILLKYSEEKHECGIGLVDIVGSIAIKDSMSEEQAKKYYDSFIESVTQIIEKHKGIAVKAIDDSVLFYFSLNDTRQTYRNTLECCLELADFSSQINEKLDSEGLPGIAYRISSTFGLVNITKSSTSVLQDIFGEPVNICFKINQYALPNTVIIEESLYEKVKDIDEYKFTKLDHSLFKGLDYQGFIVSKKTPKADS